MIIADACNNHMGDVEIIDRMIDLCPADYIKFQLYDVKELNSGWYADFDYYKHNQLDDGMVYHILHKCEQKGIKSLFTLFSISQIDRAKRLGIKNAKIASPNAHNDEMLINCIGSFDDVIVSTGMVDDRRKVQISRLYPKFLILYCISRYPTIWTEDEKEKALAWDGISDHSKSIDTALWAVRNGLWVERHYTLGKDLPGKDHHISSLPSEFEEIVRERDYLKKVERFKTRWKN